MGSLLSAPPSSYAGVSVETLQGDIQRLDGIAGVVAQTGFAATAVAVAVVATNNLSAFLSWTLGVVGVVCVIPTVVACMSLYLEKSVRGATLTREALEENHAAKRKRSRRALLILALAIEVGAGVIVCYLFS